MECTKKPRPPIITFMQTYPVINWEMQAGRFPWSCNSKTEAKGDINLEINVYSSVKKCAS